MTPRAATDPISITLEAQQWNVVIGALMEAPWRVADPVLRAITAQTNEQPAGELAGAPPPVKPNGAGEAETHTA